MDAHDDFGAGFPGGLSPAENELKAHLATLGHEVDPLYLKTLAAMAMATQLVADHVGGCGGGSSHSSHMRHASTFLLGEYQPKTRRTCPEAPGTPVELVFVKAKPKLPPSGSLGVPEPTEPMDPVHVPKPAWLAKFGSGSTSSTGICGGIDRGGSDRGGRGRHDLEAVGTDYLHTQLVRVDSAADWAAVLDAKPTHVLDVPESRNAAMARFMLPTMEQFQAAAARAIGVASDAVAMYTDAPAELGSVLQVASHAMRVCGDEDKRPGLPAQRLKWLKELEQKRVQPSLRELFVFFAMHTCKEDRRRWDTHGFKIVDTAVKARVAVGNGPAQTHKTIEVNWRCRNESCPGHAATRAVLDLLGTRYSQTPGLHKEVAVLARAMKQTAKSPTQGLDMAGIRKAMKLASTSGSVAAPISHSARPPPRYETLPRLSKLARGVAETEGLSTLLRVGRGSPYVHLVGAHAYGAGRAASSSASFLALFPEASHWNHLRDAAATFVLQEEQGTSLVQRLALVPCVATGDLVDLVLAMDAVEDAEDRLIAAHRVLAGTFGVVEDEASHTGRLKYVQPCPHVLAGVVNLATLVVTRLEALCGVCKALCAKLRTASFQCIEDCLMPYARASDKQFRNHVFQATMTRLGAVVPCPASPTMLYDLPTREWEPSPHCHGSCFQSVGTTIACTWPGCADPTLIDKVVKESKCDVCHGSAFCVSAPYTTWLCDCKSDPFDSGTMRDTVIGSRNTLLPFLQEDMRRYRRAGAILVEAGLEGTSGTDSWWDGYNPGNEAGVDETSWRAAVSELRALEYLAPFYAWQTGSFVAPYTSIDNPEALEVMARKQYDHHVELARRKDSGSRHGLVAKPCLTIDCVACGTPIVLPTVAETWCSVCVKAGKPKAKVVLRGEQGREEICNTCGVSATTHYLNEEEEHRTFSEDGEDNSHAGRPTDRRLHGTLAVSYSTWDNCTREQSREARRAFRIVQSLPVSYQDRDFVAGKGTGASELGPTAKHVLRDGMKRQFFELMSIVMDAKLVDYSSSEWAKECFCSLRQVAKLNNLFEQCLRLVVMAILRTHAHLQRLPKVKDVVCEACEQVIPKGPLFLYHYQTCPGRFGGGGAEAGAGAGVGAGAPDPDSSTITTMTMSRWCQGDGDGTPCPLCGVGAPTMLARRMHARTCPLARALGLPVKRAKVETMDSMEDALQCP